MGAEQAGLRADAEKGQERMRSFRWVLMRHHGSNHRALVLRLESDPRGVKCYVKARKMLAGPAEGEDRGRRHL